MSLRAHFRIRSRDSNYATSKGLSLQHDQDNWFDDLRQKKLRCRKTLDDSYGNISLQQMQLRSAIRGISADRPHPEKENSLAHFNSQTSINEPAEKPKRQQLNKELKEAVRALTHVQGEFVPSRVDNFHLNQQLIRKDNDPLWNKLSYNPKQAQVLLYKSHNTVIGDRRNCCFKVMKMHRKYILKVLIPQGKYGTVLSKDKWEELWKEHPSFEQIGRCLQLGPEGKLLINFNTSKPFDEADASNTSSHATFDKQ